MPLDHCGIITIGTENALTIDLLIGVTNHREQRLSLRRSVDHPIGIKNLVPAVFRIRLCKHHQFNIGRVSLKLPIGCAQIVDFVLGQRQS